MGIFKKYSNFDPKKSVLEWRKGNRAQAFMSRRHGIDKFMGTDVVEDDDLPALFQAILDHANPPSQLAAVRCVRELLQAGAKVNELLQNGLTGLLIGCLQDADASDLKAETIHCLDTIVNYSAEWSLQVLQGGALRPLLLQIAQPELYELIVKLLQAIMFENGQVLRTGPILDHLLVQIGTMTTATMVLQLAHSVVWLLNVLCFHANPPLPNAAVPSVLSALQVLMANSNGDVVKQAVQAVGDLMQSSAAKRRMLVSSQALPLVVTLLGHERPLVNQAAIFVINQLFMEYRELPLAMALTALPHYSRLFEDSTLCSTAGPFLDAISRAGPAQVQAVMDLGLHHKCIYLVSTGHWQAYAFVCRIVRSLLVTAPHASQIAELTHPGMIRALCKLFRNHNSDVSQQAFTTLRTMIVKAEHNREEVVSIIATQSAGTMLLLRLKMPRNSAVFQ